MNDALLRLLTQISERSSVEERLSQAKASWRRGRAELERIEAKLGERALDVEARLERRAQLSGWLQKALAWLPFGSAADDERWQKTRGELELYRNAVGGAEGELAELRKLEQALDELLLGPAGESLPKPELAELRAELDRKRKYLEQLDAAYEVGVEAQQHANQAIAAISSRGGVSGGVQ